MLLYALIIMALAGGVTAWMGLRTESGGRSMKARMNARNHWLKIHAIAKETDEAARSDKDAETPQD